MIKMKKKVLGLALVAMSLAAFNGSAQNTTTVDNTVCKENRICTKNVDCKNQATCLRGDIKGRVAKADPYAGLTLTDAQKAKLEQLDNKCRTARKEQAQARQEKRLKNDADRRTECKAARKSYLEEVKTIIGPDQYVVFLENMYINGGGQQHRGHKAYMGHKSHDKKARAMRGGKNDSKGERGQRGNKGVRTANTANVASAL